MTTMKKRATKQQKLSGAAKDGKIPNNCLLFKLRIFLFRAFFLYGDNRCQSTLVHAHKAYSALCGLCDGNDCVILAWSFIYRPGCTHCPPTPPPLLLPQGPHPAELNVPVCACVQNTSSTRSRAFVCVRTVKEKAEKRRESLSIWRRGATAHFSNHSPSQPTCKMYTKGAHTHPQQLTRTHTLAPSHTMLCAPPSCRGISSSRQ